MRTIFLLHGRSCKQVSTRRPKKTRGLKSPAMERQKHQFHPFPVSHDPKSVIAWRNKTKPMKNRTTNRSRLRPTWFLSTEPFAETLCRNNFDRTGQVCVERRDTRSAEIRTFCMSQSGCKSASKIKKGRKQQKRQLVKGKKKIKIMKFPADPSMKKFPQTFL